jgi:hypothetical protein
MGSQAFVAVQFSDPMTREYDGVTTSRGPEYWSEFGAHRCSSRCRSLPKYTNKVRVGVERTRSDQPIILVHGLFHGSIHPTEENSVLSSSGSTRLKIRAIEI